MNCTFSQVRSLLNSVVDAYIKKGFTVVNGYNVYDRWELSKDNMSVRVEMIFGSETKTDFDYPLHFIDITVTEICGLMANLYHFYQLGSGDYYTTDIRAVRDYQKLNLQRYLDKLSYTHTTCSLNISKISARVMSYLKRKICSQLSKMNRSDRFEIYEVYYSYNYNNKLRQLVVVIKHSDNVATEAVYIR